MWIRRWVQISKCSSALWPSSYLFIYYYYYYFLEVCRLVFTSRRTDYFTFTFQHKEFLGSRKKIKYKVHGSARCWSISLNTQYVIVRKRYAKHVFTFPINFFKHGGWLSHRSKHRFVKKKKKRSFRGSRPLLYMLFLYAIYALSLRAL